MSFLILCCVLSIFAGIMGDFEWWPLVKQVRPVDSDVPPPPFSVNEPSRGVRDPIEARVDQSSVANVVEVTPCAPPPTAAKRKCSE